MKLRVKEIAKARDIDMQTLSKKLGITYQALNARLTGNPTIKVLESLAEALGCSVIELLPTSEDFSHFYDSTTGEWLGVRKK